MKRLLPLLGLLLAFSLPNHAQTKTDTIKFEVTLEEKSATLEYKFSEQVRNGIEIEWVSANGTESGKFSPDTDGNYTRTISGSGTGYIYYTYTQGSTYSAHLSPDDYDYFDDYDIKVITGQRIITTLDVSDCPALMALSCWQNQLTSLDVSQNTALTRLDCFYNQLTSLDVSKNTALDTLWCSNNQLTSLDLSKNTALTDLYCQNNQLTSLDVSKNTALTELGCYDNQLTSLDVSKNTALTDLYCQNNQLTSLDVSKNTALTELDCGDNQLTSLDLSQNTALTKLDCYRNQLTALDVSQNTALTNLGCFGNQLTSLDVSKNTALTDLRCEWNQLTSLDVSHNTALTRLWCDKNQLTSLDVSHNTALTDLDCYDNQLTGLDVSKNTALTDLRCEWNQLTRLDVSKNTALTYLDCSYNQLTSLDVSQNTALTQLQCYGNHIPLSDLHKAYIQNSNWNWFSAYGQSDTLTLLIDQVLDLSSERLLGETPSTFRVSPDDAYTENDFTFQFKKTQAYTLSIENTGIRNHIPAGWDYEKVDGTALTFTYYISVEIPDGYYTVQVASNNEQWGTATIEGEGLYEEGENVTITATPKEGYRFVNWTKGGEVFSTEAEYTFAVSENLDLTANFELDTYTVNLASNDSAWGSVSQSGSGIYRKGENVTITATPNHNCRFVNWTNGDTVFSREAKYTFEVTENLELTAHFEVVSHTVILSSNNAEWGLASLIGNGIYKVGDSVTIIATPKTGYRFDKWTNGDAVFSTEAIYTFIVRENIELVAHFEKIQEEPEGFILSLFADNPEQGYVFRSGNNCTYGEGEEVMILALPKEGYRFDKWTKGDAVFSKEALHTLFVTEDMELTAYFERLPDDVAIGNPQEDDFHVYVLDHNIILSENRGLVQVFNAIGQCVYSGNATIIPVRQSGVYVVRVGTNSHKVIVR